MVLKMSEIFLKMKKFIGENFENTCEDEVCCGKFQKKNFFENEDNWGNSKKI